MAAYELIRSDGCMVRGEIVAQKVHGIVRVFWPDGTPREVKGYDMNTPTGTHTTYDAEGQVIETIEYLAGQVIAVNGQPMPPIDAE